MKIFIDTANLSDIEAALQRGFVSGVTTNPSILAKEKQIDFKQHIAELIALLRRYKQEVPLSVEVFTSDPEEMIRQAEDFMQTFAYDSLNIKVPIGWEELRVIHNMRQRGVRVNCTCCMSYNQAVMAAAAGANYVSLFYNRIRDVGYDGRLVVEQTAQTFRQHGVDSEIIVGSIRHLCDVNDAFMAGAHIVTVPPKFFPQLVAHPKTDEAVNQFIADFRNMSAS
ncbi:MAG: transaldolase family protein [Candidatus Omnitrophota bacterium]